MILVVSATARATIPTEYTSAPENAMGYMFMKEYMETQVMEPTEPGRTTRRTGRNVLKCRAILHDYLWYQIRRHVSDGP